MADHLAEAEAAPAILEAPRAVRSAGRPHRRRFLAVYGVLASVLAGSVAGLVLLVANGGPEDGPAWSLWRPEGDETAMLQQIADHVSAAYRLPSGQQLVSVQAAPARVQDIPIGAIAIRRPASAADQPITIFPVEGTAVYILCGLGTDCAIEEGTPSAERLRLLRRESLELALYTFRYVGGKDSVVTFLPPPPGEEASFALFMRRGDLEGALDRPLRATLPIQKPPAQPEQIPPLEVQTIDRLTGPALYRFSFQQLQDGTAVLVLDDPSLPPPADSQSEQPSGGDASTQ